MSTHNFKAPKQDRSYYDKYQANNSHIESEAFILQLGLSYGIPIKDIITYRELNYNRELQFLDGATFMERVKKDLTELAGKKMVISAELYVTGDKSITEKEMNEFMDDVIELVEKNGWDCTGSGFKLEVCEDTE